MTEDQMITNWNEAIANGETQTVTINVSDEDYADMMKIVEVEHY